MYYTAEEHMCAATSDSPLGPFIQEVKKPMLEGEKTIDNSLFIDDDGTPYLFFDRFNDGLNIWVAELEKDLITLKKQTLHPCIHVSQEWEKVWPRVNEGAFVTKHNGRSMALGALPPRISWVNGQSIRIIPCCRNPVI